MNNDTDNPTPILTAMLKSPNWGDERDRIVHLEGLAVAQQVQMYIGLTVAAAMPWALGKIGIWWGFAVLAATLVGNLSYARYVSARGVRLHTILEAGERMRGALTLAIFAVFAVGVIRAQSNGSTPPPTANDALQTVLGIGAGFAVGIGIAILIVKVVKRHQTTDVPDDVFVDG